MARPLELVGRDFSVEAAASSSWLVASVVQFLVSRSCNKVARSYGGSIGEGMVSSPFAHCDRTNKHCVDDTAVRVAHGHEEQLGQTYSGEMQCQNAWWQDDKL
jgi:hypothetical protein